MLVAALSANAQHINNVFAFKSEKKQSMTVNIELDPAFFWGITYNRNFNVRLGDFERRLIAQVGWKTFKFNYNDLNLNFITTIWNQQSRPNVLINFGAENKYLENVIHQANVYNWVMSVMPGYIGDSWYIGTELMCKWLFRVKYDQTDFYRSIFPEVVDGWYSYKTMYSYISLNAGVKWSNNMDIDFRAGYRFTHKFTNYQPYIQPYFADLAINFRF